MNLHLLFDCKYHAQIAHGVINMLESRRNINDGNHCFYKSAQDGRFVRLSGGDTGRPLTIIYGGASRRVFDKLIHAGILKVSATAEEMPHSRERGFRVERSI